MGSVLRAFQRSVPLTQADENAFDSCLLVAFLTAFALRTRLALKNKKRALILAEMDPVSCKRCMHGIHPS